MSQPVVTFITGAPNAVKSCSQVLCEEIHPILEYSRIFYEELFRGSNCTAKII
jgi:hypothetical protein